MNENRRRVLVTLLALSACRAPTPPPEATDAPLTYRYGDATLSHEEIEITLERGECFGECPVYSVTLFGSGQVEFHGEKYTKVLGEAGWEVPTSTVQVLVSCLAGYPLSEFKDTRNDRVSDVPTIRLRIRLGAKSYDIENRWGGVFSGEDAPTL